MFKSDYLTHTKLLFLLSSMLNIEQFIFFFYCKHFHACSYVLFNRYKSGMCGTRTKDGSIDHVSHMTIDPFRSPMLFLEGHRIQINVYWQLEKDHLRGQYFTLLCCLIWRLDILDFALLLLQVIPFGKYCE